MQPVESCLHCQFLCRILKALFHQTSTKNKSFLKKMQNFEPLQKCKNHRSIANFCLRALLQHIRIFEVLCLKFLSSPPHQNFLDPPLYMGIQYWINYR